MVCPADPLEMKVHQRIDQVPLSAWNAVRDRDNLLADPSFLKAIEEARVVECDYRYFEFREADRLVCTMSGGIIDNDLLMFSNPTLKKLASVIRESVPSFLKRRTLEIGSPLGFGTTLSHAGGITPGQWGDIIRKIQAYARRRRIQLVVVRDFSGPRHEVEDALLESGFRALFNLPLARMHIVWDSFDDYLMAMRKPMRQNIRRKIRKKQAYGIRTVLTSDGLKHLDRCLELFENVRSRSSRFNRDTIGEDYFRAMSRNLREHSHWGYYFHGDRLVTFTHFVSYRKQLVAQIVGMDYDVSTRAMLYFNSHYDLLRWAFDHGLDTYQSGITSYEPKSAAGLSVIPQVMYLWMPDTTVLDVVTFLWGRMTSYGIEGCHYAFKGRKYQYIWDGRTRP